MVWVGRRVGKTERGEPMRPPRLERPNDCAVRSHEDVTSEGDELSSTNIEQVH